MRKGKFRSRCTRYSRHNPHSDRSGSRMPDSQRQRPMSGGPLLVQYISPFQFFSFTHSRAVKTA
jgi:hypothetical protein